MVPPEPPEKDWNLDGISKWITELAHLILYSMFSTCLTPQKGKNQVLRDGFAETEVKQEQLYPSDSS